MVVVVVVVVMDRIGKMITRRAHVYDHRVCVLHTYEGTFVLM